LLAAAEVRVVNPAQVLVARVEVAAIVLQ